MGERQLLGLPAAGHLPRRGKEPQQRPREGECDCGTATAPTSWLRYSRKKNLVAPLSKGRPVLVIPRVENVHDLGEHLVEKQDLLDLIHRGWLQGIELVL